MNLRRWLANPIVIAALVEFAFIVAIVFLILTRT
jgi:hypothetical protein